MKSTLPKASTLSHRNWGTGPKGQSGVILAITMIVLVVMLVAGIALVRSFNASTAVAGNLGYRRDLVNQGEQAVYAAYTNFTTATALNQLARQGNSATYNYSACQLNVDVHGVPTLLADDTNFANTADLTTEPWADGNCSGSAVAAAANDIGPDANGITVRYVVDRLCTATGVYSIQTCTTTPPTTQPAFTVTNNPYISQTPVPVYRLSVRATDARGARTYMQITFSN